MNACVQTIVSWNFDDSANRALIDRSVLADVGRWRPRRLLPRRPIFALTKFRVWSAFAKDFNCLQ